jgi:hypothetical protein
VNATHLFSLRSIRRVKVASIRNHKWLRIAVAKHFLYWS